MSSLLALPAGDAKTAGWVPPSDEKIAALALVAAAASGERAEM